MFGRIKEFANGRTLFLDIDSGRAPGLRRMWGTLRTLGVRCDFTRYDRTRQGWHIVIRLKERLDPVTIVAMQAVLGSDLRREALNLRRVLSDYGKEGEKRWNILYSVKLKKRRA